MYYYVGLIPFISILFLCMRIVRILLCATNGVINDDDIHGRSPLPDVLKVPPPGNSYML